MVKYKITTKLISSIIPLALIMLVCTCSNDDETVNRYPVPTTLNISLAPGQAPAQAVKVDKVVVFVQGENIEEPIEQELKIEGDYATGLLKVPPGEVEFTVVAFAEEQVVYEGREHIMIEAGRKITVDIQLHRPGEVPQPQEPEPTQPVEVGEMVLIPAGEFEMGDNFNEGDDNKLPVHTVYLDAFLIDKYEVTVGQYKKFIEATGHRASNWNDVAQYSPTDQHPIIHVSWRDAAAYAQWASKRLPTEAEWEKAARGGLKGKRYPWGDDISHDNANYSGTGGRDIWDITSPVGSFPPNGYGLYDMAGNVWEWCADEYDSGYYSISPKNNPKGPGVVVTFRNNDFTNVTSWRVLRGGSWGSNTYDLRCAYRDNIVPTNAGSDVGFRCSQDR